MLTRISDVARVLDVNEYVIRYWSDIFNIHPLRSQGAHRHFSPEQVETFKELYRLLRVELYTVKGAKRQLKKAKDDK
jgi:DNA-binding transcriptional MerR regulator